MNRRDFITRFLGGAAGAAVAHTLDLDKLLWTPGERTIFLPSADDWIPNTFVSSDWIRAEALRGLQNELTVVKAFNREYDNRFKVGDRIMIRVPKGWKRFEAKVVREFEVKAFLVTGTC